MTALVSNSRAYARYLGSMVFGWLALRPGSIDLGGLAQDAIRAIRVEADRAPLTELGDNPGNLREVEFREVGLRRRAEGLRGSCGVDARGGLLLGQPGLEPAPEGRDRLGVRLC